MADAVDVANAYAAEHVQLATADPGARHSAGLRYAGEALLGQDTPIGASSYTIGIPATLPTGGYAQLNGGVTARTFMTSTSTARLSPEALAGLAEPTLALADHEGFPAHAAVVPAARPGLAGCLLVGEAVADRVGRLDRAMRSIDPLRVTVLLEQHRLRLRTPARHRRPSRTSVRPRDQSSRGSG